MCEELVRMDTLVDPVEVLPLSSGRMEVAPPLPPPPRASMPSFEPDGTQWFERVFVDPEASSSIDVEVHWEEESDSCPTLVAARPRVLG
jgi:hypothetical protein